jgi:hypothetical protein
MLRAIFSDTISGSSEMSCRAHKARVLVSDADNGLPADLLFEADSALLREPN